MVNASGLCCQKASPTFRLASRHSFRYAFALPARISQSKYKKGPQIGSTQQTGNIQIHPNTIKYPIPK
jgi:hypothetical protein